VEKGYLNIAILMNHTTSYLDAACAAEVPGCDSMSNGSFPSTPFAKVFTELGISQRAREGACRIQCE